MLSSPSYLFSVYICSKVWSGRRCTPLHQAQQWHQILNSPRWLAIIVLIVIMVYNRPYNTHFARQSLSIALVLSYYVPNCFHFNPSQKIMKNCQAHNWRPVLFIHVTILEQSSCQDEQWRVLPSDFDKSSRVKLENRQRCNQRYPASYTQLARNNSNV